VFLCCPIWFKAPAPRSAKLNFSPALATVTSLVHLGLFGARPTGDDGGAALFRPRSSTFSIDPVVGGGKAAPGLQYCVPIERHVASREMMLAGEESVHLDRITPPNSIRVRAG